MGGIMIRFVIAAFISILTIKGAFADINVFIAPNDLNYETNSTSEINHYLDELKKNNTKVDVDKDPKISNELKKYIGIVNDRVSDVFSESEFKKYRGDVCKISITTGNTAPSDPILTQVFALEQLADNGLKPCRELNNKLVSVIDKDDNFKYPAVVKNYGLLSMDMIFYFNNN